MKIKTKTLSLDEVLAMSQGPAKKPKRPNLLFRSIVRLASIPDLLATRFSYEFANKREILSTPSLILMNHSCFLDLGIASKILYPHPYGIVCTSDGFVGKSWLMRQIGCIPTQKFVSDMRLIRDMRYALEKNRTHVLMYPEASYSFDGCATPLPRRMGSFLKLLGVPVIMIKTEGAFLRDPLYNNLQKRRVRVRAKCERILTCEEIGRMSVEELDARLDAAFDFDGFRWQRENGVEVNEPFRADGLERILYKCAACGKEGTMQGKGTLLTCTSCQKQYELTPLGELAAKDGKTEFTHVPDWYAWERECVRKELTAKEYLLDTPVRIAMLVDQKALYWVGEGRLVHNENGFELNGCEGKLHYEQKPLSSYGLYADYFWYEIGDVICIGNSKALYYCFPEQEGVVSKARLAAEELYKLCYERKRSAEGKEKTPSFVAP